MAHKSKLKEKLINKVGGGPVSNDVWIYRIFYFFWRFWLVKILLLIPTFVFVKIAPDIPVSLHRTFSGKSGFRAFITGFLITLIVCFGGSILVSYFNDTLQGDDPNVVYFLEDSLNIWCYTLICPLYVGFTAWLGVTVFKGWSNVSDYREELEGTDDDKSYKDLFDRFWKWLERALDSIRPFPLILLIVSVAIWLSVNYMTGLDGLKNDSVRYWFVSASHDWGFAGIYYALINFLLLFVVLFAFTMFMSMYRIAWKVGDALRRHKDPVARNPQQYSVEVLRNRLSAFTESYLLAKIIVALLILNIWIWRDSALGLGTENVGYALGFMAIIGVLLLSIPRYYIELQWHRLNVLEGNDPVAIDFQQAYIARIGGLIDTFFIGGFLFYAGNYFSQI